MVHDSVIGHAGGRNRKGWQHLGVSTGTEYTRSTRISDVISDPAMSPYGRLLFPLGHAFWSGRTLGDLHLAWYSCIDPNKTVEICNYVRQHAKASDTVFVDIYSGAEKAADPAKKNTGLFFFRGKPGARVAICNAGGGFVYVGAMQDSLPHALEISRMGYNAFALIYRPGAQTACEDLARAIQVLFDRASDLRIDMDGYSLWGGSAGARMAAWVGSYGTAAFGARRLPRPGAIIMQHTGFDECSRHDAPTYACVGDGDGIADWRNMRDRLKMLQRLGVPTEFHVYPGLSHGFGLGTGTVADGWIRDAVEFWQKQVSG